MEYMNLSEAAKALQLSVPTVKRYIYEGKLRSAKLPGGQHRIANSEIERLLSAGDQLPTGEAPAAADARVEVLERWVTDLQEEVERLGAALQVMSRYCGRSPQGERATARPGVPDGGHRIAVLGPGCRKCNALFDLTAQTLRDLGHGDTPVEQVKDLDDIAAYGPVVTPALVIDDTILLSGRVPTGTALRDALIRHLQ